MSSVDNRIVQMEMDNRNFERGVQEVIKSLDALTKALQLKNADKGLTSIESKAKKFDISSMSNNVQHVADSFSAMGAIAFTVFQRLTNAAIDAGKKIAGALINPLIEGGKRRALNIEQAKFQIEGLGYAWEDVAEDINYGVKDTAYGLDSAAKAASQLLASNVAIGDSMKQALRGISGVAAMTSSEYDDIARVFTTVAGNGRLMGDQLLQLSTRGLNVAATLGKALGKSEQEIRDMVSKGQIDFATFAKAMDDAFGTHAKEANKTFTGALSNMKAALSRIGAEFAAPSFEALRRVMIALIPIIDGVKASLAPLIDDYKNILDQLAEFAEGVAASFDVKPVEDFVNKVHILINGLIPVVTSLHAYLTSFASSVREAFEKTFPSLSDESVKKLSDGLTAYAKKLELSEDAAKGIKTTFENMFQTIKNVGAIFSKVATPFSFALKSVWENVVEFSGYVSNLISYIRSLTDVLVKNTNVTNEMLGIFTSLAFVVKTISGILPIFGSLAVKVFKKLASAGAISGTFIDPLSKVTNTLMEFSRSLWGFINSIDMEPILETVSDFISNIVLSLGDLVSIGATSAVVFAKSMGDAIKAIIPMFGETATFISELPKRFRSIVSGIKNLNNFSDRLKNTFDGLFSVFRLIGAVLSAVGSAFAALFEVIFSNVDVVKEFDKTLDNTSSIGLAFSSFVDNLIEKINSFSEKLNDAIRNGEVFGKFVKSIADLFHRCTEQITEFFKAITDSKDVTSGFYKVMLQVGSIIQKVFSGVVNVVNDLISNLNFDDVLAILNTAVAGGMLKVLYDLIVFFKKGEFQILFEWGRNLDSTLSIVRGSLLDMQRTLQVGNIIGIAVALAILASAVRKLSEIDPVALGKAGVAIVGLYKGLSYAITKIPTGALNGSVVNLVLISVALNSMAKAVEKFSQLDLISLGKGLIATGVALAEFSLFLNKTDLSKSINPSTGIGLIALAVSLRVLASAVDRLGSLDLATLAKGLIAVGIALAEFAIFSKYTSTSKGMMSTGIGMMFLATSMVVLSKAIESFGSMDVPTLAKGFGSLALALTLITVAINKMPKNSLSVGVSLLFISTAVSTISKALERLGNMSVEQIAKSIGTLAVSLGILVFAVGKMNRIIPGAMALIIVAGALSILAPVLVLFGSMSLEQIGTSLLMLAGVFTVVGVAGSLLAPMAPALLAVAGAVALFGAGCLAAGLGITLFATGLVALAGALGTNFSVIISTLKGLIELIPFIVEKVGEALVQLVQIVLENVPEIVDLLVQALSSILTGLSALIPQVIETIGFLITSILEKVVEMAPTVIQAGFDLIIAFLTGIRDNIGEIVSLGAEIVLNFIQGITEKIPDFVEAGFNMIITFIDSLAETINTEGERLREAVGNLVMAIINFAIETIMGLVGAAGEAGMSFLSAVMDGIGVIGANLPGFVKGFISNALNGILGFLGGFLNAGRDLMDNVVNGLTQLGVNIASTVKRFIEDARQAAVNIGKKFVQVGKDLIQGLINGVKQIGSRIASTVTGFVNDAIDGAKRLLGIASPSKVFKKIGNFLTEGFIIGIKKNSDNVYDATRNMTDKAIEGAKYGLDALSDYISKNDSAVYDLNVDRDNFDKYFDLNPVITPVVDMSNVENASDYLDSAFKRRGFDINTSSMNYRPGSLGFDESDRMLKKLDAIVSKITSNEDPVTNIYIDGAIINDDLQMQNVTRDFLLELARKGAM